MDISYSDIFKMTMVPTKKKIKLFIYLNYFYENWNIIDENKLMNYSPIENIEIQKLNSSNITKLIKKIFQNMP